MIYLSTFLYLRTFNMGVSGVTVIVVKNMSGVIYFTSRIWNRITGVLGAIG